MSACIESLTDEYTSSLATMADSDNDDEVVGRLISDHDWTVEGARALVSLARRYGSFILLNATALALSLQIEDGEAGL